MASSLIPKGARVVRESLEDVCRSRRRDVRQPNGQGGRNRYDARPRLADAVTPPDDESMETGAHRRWRSLADDGILPRNVRLSFEVLGVIALAAAYVGTGSELAQALVLFGWLLIVLPVARRIFQPIEPDEHWLVVRRNAYPAGVFAPAVLGMLVMVAVGSVVLI